ncbi:hypothetical protein [uncultured Tateyamaria sp.]|uniref:hypothetical protein n=1 Tax=uncultured Tateyamaria sp. TaxID=455651 RepID=UPI002607C0A8|nr:hypothetical protein [uncultured Tateyamaria sp.]
MVNKDHFAAISYLRENPIIPMGFAAMVMQGLIMSVALRAWREGDATIANGFAIAAAFGVFLIAYITLVEPAKYETPDIFAWIRVEAFVGLVQFSAFGILLGLIHSKLG